MDKTTKIWTLSLAKTIKTTKSFNYPFSKSIKNVWNIPINLKIKNSFGRLLSKQPKKRDKNVKIWLAEQKEMVPLKEKDFPLIFVIHNGRRFLPSFLKHYRDLGVTRFLCVDDASTDGTIEYLLNEPDVDVHFSNVRYGAAARSKTWRELLAALYGKNRWYLNVDVDEYLFTGCNATMSISDYANHLYVNDIYRLPAPMIDMVPGGSLDEAVLDDYTDPWKICDFFDAAGYSGTARAGGLKLYGGARERLWNADVELMKYPLIYWDDHTSMGVSIHSPWPTHRNHAPVCGALLHFKVFADVKKISKRALDTGQYFDGNREYKLMLDYFSKSETQRLTYEGSIHFENEETLIKNGMVKLI